MKPVRRIPRETAAQGLLVFAGGAVVSVLLPTQLQGLSWAEGFALAAMPSVVVGAVGFALWRGGRYTVRRDSAPLLALPDAGEEAGPLRAPPNKKTAPRWVWLAVGMALCYAAAATSFVIPTGVAEHYLFEPRGLRELVQVRGGLSWVSGRFWEFLAASAAAGVLAFLAWLDASVET